MPSLIGNKPNQVPSNGDLGTMAFREQDQFYNTQQSLGFKNRIINGAMTINQRAGGTVTVNQYFNYITDRWCAFANVNGKYTSAQSSTVPTGFNNSLIATSTSAYSVSSGDVFNLGQYIEGFNTADLGWGTANAATVTLSFWVRSSLTGTFGGAIRNSAEDRSYPFTYTISSANTWEQKTITVAGDTTGTWLTTNGIGIRVIFGLGVGSTYSGTAGAWAGANYYSATGATSVVGTSGATFYITGVQLEKGSTATSFDYRPYGTELALCQRYFCKAMTASGYANTTTQVGLTGSFPVTMRTSPTMGLTGVLAITDGAANYTQSSISVGTFLGTDTGFFLASAGNFTGLTQYRPCVINYSVNGNLLTASAEL
jgi:hypothetical protein